MAEKSAFAGGILHFRWSAIGIFVQFVYQKHSAKDKTAETKRMSSMNSADNSVDRVDSENEVGISFIKLQSIANSPQTMRKQEPSLLASINR